MWALTGVIRMWTRAYFTPDFPPFFNTTVRRCQFGKLNKPSWVGARSRLDFISNGTQAQLPKNLQREEQTFRLRPRQSSGHVVTVQSGNTSESNLATRPSNQEVTETKQGEKDWKKNPQRVRALFFFKSACWPHTEVWLLYTMCLHIKPPFYKHQTWGRGSTKKEGSNKNQDVRTYSSSSRAVQRVECVCVCVACNHNSCDHMCVNVCVWALKQKQQTFSL